MQKTNILRKTAFGLLVGLMWMLGVQGVAVGADLPLAKGSGDFQEKTPGNRFDITFSISPRSNTTDIKNDNNKLVTDGRAITNPNVSANTQARINRSGYLIMDVGRTEYRTGTDIPNTGYYRETSASPWTETNTGGTLVIGNTNTNVYFVPENTATAYQVYNEKLDTSGNSLSPKEGNTSSSLTADPNPPVPLINRYHYNEEAIKIEVVKGEIISNNDFAEPADDTMTFALKAFDFRPISNLTEKPGTRLETLPRSVTLICTPKGSDTKGIYRVRIIDDTASTDQPDTPDEERFRIEFTLRVTDDEYAEAQKIVADDGSSDGTAYFRTETNKKIKQINTDFTVTEGNNLEIRYKIKEGRGDLYAAASETATPYRGPNQDLSVHQDAKVFLETNGSDNEVEASIADSPLTEPTARIFYAYTGTDPASGPSADDTERDTTPTVSVSPTSLSGAPGTPQALTVSAGTTDVRVQGDAAFRSAGGTLSGTGTARSVTLPNRVGTYSLTVSASGYNDRIIPLP